MTFKVKLKKNSCRWLESIQKYLRAEFKNKFRKKIKQSTTLSSLRNVLAS
jgi:hypothetical protein